jgi:hydroxymethylglutaryl-CoA synthase
MTAEMGIAAYGAYVPPLRVSREEIAAAHAWSSPGLGSRAKGERSTAGSDEDVITMAVDAARDCLVGVDRDQISGLFLGTTTAPFTDRLNAGVVAAALGLGETSRAQDMTGSERAASSALLSAFDCAAARGGQWLCCASEQRAAAAATTRELTTGHAAASVLVSPGQGLARLVASATLTVDFVDHYRSTGQAFDYDWEERWIRDEGYLKTVPRVIGAVLDQAGITPGEVTSFCLGSILPRVDQAVAIRAGLPEASVRDALATGCGHTGAAHPILMLVSALESAHPGDRILVVGFGQGVDAMLFEVCDAIVEYQRRRTGVSRWLTQRSSCSYVRYLALNNLLKVDRGIRSEADKSTSMTASFRHRGLLTALIGGRCRVCGTHQIPSMRICVNHDCRSVDSQDPYSFAESRARVVSWAADHLTYTPDPPAYYGLVDFAEGGRLMIDFANVAGSGFDVGSLMRMVFRVKDHDTLRGFTRYFWKAAPVVVED